MWHKSSPSRIHQSENESVRKGWETKTKRRDYCFAVRKCSLLCFNSKKNLFFNQETHARCTQHHGRYKTIDVDNDDGTTTVAIVIVEAVVLTLMLINANADMDGVMREKGSQVS